MFSERIPDVLTRPQALCIVFPEDRRLGDCGSLVLPGINEARASGALKVKGLCWLGGFRSSTSTKLVMYMIWAEEPKNKQTHTFHEPALSLLNSFVGDRTFDGLVFCIFTES